MKKQLLYPSLVSRLVASCLDLLILSIFASVFMYIIASIIYMIPLLNKFFQGYLMWVSFILHLLIAFIFFNFFWYRYQKTPGKFLLNQKIVNEVNLDSPTLYQCVKRFFGYMLFPIGIWSISFRKNGQAWHDRVSGTLVIKK